MPVPIRRSRPAIPSEDEPDPRETAPLPPHHDPPLEATPPDPLDERPIALQLLGAATSDEAREAALDLLGQAMRCDTCKRLLAHLFDRLGSTLFLDEDPRQLVDCFDPADRDERAATLLAACVVWFGRPRVTIFPDEGAHT